MNKKIPYILILPETLGSSGIIGLFAKDCGDDLQAMKELVTQHTILICLPSRPMTPERFSFFAEEINTFKKWVSATFDNKWVDATFDTLILIK